MPLEDTEQPLNWLVKISDEAYVAARAEQFETGACFIHPFDDLAIIEGQATVAMEMLQQQPEMDTIVVPAGGGGYSRARRSLLKRYVQM